MSKNKKVLIYVETSRSTNRGSLKGIARYAKLCNSWEIIRQPPFYMHHQQRKDFLNSLISWGVEGVIAQDSSDVIELINLGIPCISIIVQDKFPHIPMLVDDPQPLARMAFGHLRERGFVYYAFCGLKNFIWSQIRKEGFLAEVSRNGFSCEIFDLPQEAISEVDETERNRLGKWLQDLPKPVGLFVCNDECCEYVLKTCQYFGFSVPCQIALLGVDDDEMICNFANPTLSSIALKNEYGGFEAAALLDCLMRKEIEMAGQKIIVGPSYVVSRQSTDVLAISNPVVISAIEYIRKCCRRPVQVQDVVEASACSRRHLERLFRKYLGMSILDTIRQHRVEQIVRMLLETDETIQRIAYLLGFPGVEQLDRFFRQAKGVSPLNFRKQHIKLMSDKPVIIE